MGRKLSEMSTVSEIYLVIFTFGVLNFMITTARADDVHDEEHAIQKRSIINQDKIYGYQEYILKNLSEDPTICFNQEGISVNGTTYTNFTCPLPNQDITLNKCCSSKARCCKSKRKKEPPKETETIITTISIIAAVAVSLGICMVLYCCCCQKRQGVHSGKLVWVKKKKDKIVYEEGGMTPRHSSGDEDGDTQLLGFVYVPEEKQNDSTDKTMEHIIEEIHKSHENLNSHSDHKKHQHEKRGSQRKHHDDKDQPCDKSISPKKSNADLEIPLITIQPSTPEQ